MYLSNLRIAVIVAGMACLLYADAARGNEQLYRKVAQATVYVSRNDGPQGTVQGTGFLIDANERLVVTARHVVETKNGLADVVAVVFAQSKDDEVITESQYYRTNWNTLAIRGKIVYESVRRDMAVLQLDKVPAGVKPLELAEKKARPGQTIHVIGNSTVILGGMFNYCNGTVRNTFRYVTGANVLATQAPTNRGDSGGPVFNNLGEVVGFCSLSTGGARPAGKNDALAGDQNVDLSICVTEIRAGLDEMRGRVAKGPPDTGKSLVLKGEAHNTVHNVRFEKDATYNVVVLADGFTPDFRIEQPTPSLIAQSPFLNSAAGVGNKAHMLFTANETGEHRLIITHFSGADLPKGPVKYSLTINKATFESVKVVKQPDIPINEHVRKLEAGKVYDIIVKSKAFEPDVRVLDAGKTVGSQVNNGVKSVGGDFETTLRFFPERTADFRIHVNVSPFSPPDVDKRPYQVLVAETKTELQVKDSLTVKDPLYAKGPFKAYPVKLEAGKTYQIDLMTTKFDGDLALEDSAGKLLMAGFDMGTFNSRMIYRPTKTDTYRVIATSHQIDASGAYALFVAESPNALAPFYPPIDKKMPKIDK